MNLYFTTKARNQLEDIYRFYEVRSPRVAAEIYNEIIDEAERLIYFPQSAPIEPILADFADTYRSLVVRKLFKIVYRIDGNTIYIVAVFDCRQEPGKLSRLFRRRKGK